MMGNMWIFNGARAGFPGGVFTTLEGVEEWIRRHGLTGTVTLYPVDQGIYDWSLDKGYFAPRNDNERSPDFIGKFTSASMEHYHYEDGIRV